MRRAVIEYWSASFRIFSQGPTLSYVYDSRAFEDHIHDGSYKVYVRYSAHNISISPSTIDHTVAALFSLSMSFINVFSNQFINSPSTRDYTLAALLSLTLRYARAILRHEYARGVSAHPKSQDQIGSII